MGLAGTYTSRNTNANNYTNTNTDANTNTNTTSNANATITTTKWKNNTCGLSFEVVRAFGFRAQAQQSKVVGSGVVLKL